MKIRSGAVAVFLLSLALYIFLFAKYIPMIPRVQAFLIPISAAVFLLTGFSLPAGAAAVLFSIPLVGALPNFFRLAGFQPLLFIFYAFVLGVLFLRGFRSLRLTFDPSIHTPLVLLAGLVAVSAIITTWRYTNFFPLFGREIPELAVNVLAVRSGEAVRRVIFDSFNVLGGLLWFVFLVPLFRDRKTLRRCLAVLAVSLGLSLGFGFFQYLGDINLGNQPFFAGFNRVNALFGDPNALGVFLAAVFCLLLALALDVRDRRAAVYGFPLLMGMVLMPAIGSRSGFVGVLISIGLFVFFHIPGRSGWKRRSRVVLLSLAGGMILIILGLTVLDRGSSLGRRLAQGFQPGSPDGRPSGILSNRIQFWKGAWSMGKDYPLHGVGIGAFTSELPNYYFRDRIVPIHPSSYYRKMPEDDRVVVDSAGNLYFHVGAELGTVGLLLLLWIFAVILRRIRRLLGRESGDPGLRLPATGAAAGVVALMGVFVFGAHTLNFEVQLAFWLNAALIFAAVRPVPGGVRPRPRFLRIAVAGLGVYALVLGWNSFHSLSLAARSREFHIEQEFGFHAWEQSGERAFRWTGAVAGIPVSLRGSRVEFPIMASHPDIRERPVRVRVDLSEDLLRRSRIVSEFIIDNGNWRDIRVDLPDKNSESAILIFRIDRTWRPSRELGSPDSRDLGIAIGKPVLTHLGLPVRGSGKRSSMLDGFARKDWQGPQGADLFLEGRSWGELDLPSGKLVIRIQARGMPAGGVWPYMEIRVDEDIIAGFWIETTDWRDYFVDIQGSGSKARVSAAFVNDGSSDSPHRDRNLFLGDAAVFRKSPAENTFGGAERPGIGSTDPR